MPKPPRRMEAKAEIIEQTAVSILTLVGTSKQDTKTQSRFSPPQKLQRSPNPQPSYIDELTLQQWTKESSLKLYFWLLYSLEFEAARDASPQPLTNIVDLKKRIESIRSDEIVSSAKFGFWGVKQRPKILRCAWEGCENEVVHPDSRDSQTGFCILHYFEEENY